MFAEGRARAAGRPIPAAVPAGVETSGTQRLRSPVGTICTAGCPANDGAVSEGPRQAADGGSVAWKGAKAVLRRIGIPLIMVPLLIAGCGPDHVESGGRDEAGPGDQQREQDVDWDSIRDRRIAEEGRRLLEEGLVETLPEAEFVRYIEPDDYAEVYVECLNEQGFPAKATGKSAFEIGEIPEDQSKSLNEAMYRCEVMYPVHPRYAQPLTDKQLNILYDYLTTELVSCLASEGYEVADAPSREVFVSRYRARSPWHPYDSVVGLSESQMNRLREICPPEPPLDRLFGED